MDTIVDLNEIVSVTMDSYADRCPLSEGLELERVYNVDAGHFELLCVGWENQRRVHGCILHLDVKDDKVWIQHDGTEDGIASALVAAGIPKDQIVLAFHPPYKRPYTGYAVA